LDSALYFFSALFVLVNGTLVIEALSKMLSATLDGSFLSGFSVGFRNSSGLHISHLLFADVTQFFCEANPEYLRYLRALFVCFEAISSLKINLTKNWFFWVMLIMLMGCPIFQDIR
jgi:hypothetical protein